MIIKFSKIKFFLLITFFASVLLTGCASTSGIPEPKTFVSEADGEIKVLSIDYDREEVGLINEGGRYRYLTNKYSPENMFTVIKIDLKNTESEKLFDFKDVVLKNENLTVRPIIVKYQQGPFVCKVSESDSAEILIPADPKDGYSVYLIYSNPAGARFDILDYKGKEIKIINSVATQTSSSTSEKKAQNQTNQKLQNAVAEIKKTKPAKGDTWFMDIEEDAETKYSASAFYASSIFLMLDENLNLSSVMNDEQKTRFTKALVENLPDFEKETDIRAIVVGDKFAEQGELRNLIILISKVQLKKDAIPGKDFAYHFLTNAVLSRDKTTGEIKSICTGLMMNSRLNYNFLAVPFDDGMLVTSGNLNLGKDVYKPELSLMDKGNLIDTFVKDEIAENDSEIEAIYKEIISAKDAEPVIKIVLAPLNYGLYLIKQGKIADAEKLWKSIDFSKLTSETEQEKNTIESLKPVFDRDIPDILTIVKNY